jgi:hypothetical protein
VRPGSGEQYRDEHELGRDDEPRTDLELHPHRQRVGEGQEDEGGDRERPPGWEEEQEGSDRGDVADGRDPAAPEDAIVGSRAGSLATLLEQRLGSRIEKLPCSSVHVTCIGRGRDALDRCASVPGRPSTEGRSRFPLGWTLTPAMVGSWSGPLSGALQVQMTAVGAGASFQVDDMYVDPYVSRR